MCIAAVGNLPQLQSCSLSIEVAGRPRTKAQSEPETELERNGEEPPNSIEW